MKYSIINYNKVKSFSTDFSINAELFTPDYIELINKFRESGYMQLKKYTNQINRGIQPEYDVEGTIKVLRSVNVRENGFSDERQEYVTQDFYNKNDKAQIKYKDVLLTSTGVGTLGRCSIALSDEKYFIDGHITKITQLKHIVPEFLYIYLNTKYGQNQINKLYKGSSGQIEIYPKQIQLLYIKPLKIQNIVSAIVINSFKNITKSNNLYFEAEELLLNELGLLNWQPEHKLFSIKNYSDVEKANRIDAEYFQPKYDEIINTITQYSNGFDKLSNIVDIKKNIEVGSEEYVEKGIPFIRVSNLTKMEINDNNLQYITEKLYDNLAKVYQPQKGEILLSKDGTAGIAFYIDEQPKNMILSGGILRLKIKNKEYLPEYLTLVLNSLIVQQQVERVSSGALIKHWLIDEVNTTLIPKLDINKQKEIVEEIVGKIQESSNCRKQSKQLLEIAKRGVEIAIEENEEIATDWINSELSKIGVEL